MATKLRANQINIIDVMNDAAAQATELRNGTLRIATQAEVNGSPYDNTIAVTPATLAGSSLNTNWVTANNGANFTNAPSVSATETNSIAIGDNASVYTGRFAAEDCIAIGTNAVAHELSNCIAIGTGADASLLSSVAIGTNAYAVKSLVIGHDSYGNNDSIVFGTNNTSGATGGYSTVVGNDNTSLTNFQMLFGKNIEVASTTADVQYAVKIGYGATNANKNMLHLFSKGKLELYGDEAQFIFPNYRTAGSPLTNPLPSTTIQGGTVYDDTDNVLKFYNGTGWMTVADGNWLHSNNGSDFATAPIGTGSNSISLGNNASTAAVADAIAIGTNVTAVVNGVSIGANSDALGTSSVALGASAQATADGMGVAIGLNTSAAGSGSIAIGTGSSTAAQRSVTLGYDSDTLVTNQIAIGNECKSTSVTSDVTYSVKIGEGADANKNMLHLFSQGKLELYGDAAQFVMPNYVWGSPAVEPATATEGGVVYDSTAQGLKVYDGAAWQAVGGGSGVTNPLTADLDTGGWNIITAVEAVAGNSDALTIRTGNTTHAGTSQSGNLVLQTGHGFSDNDSGDITVATGGAVSAGGSGTTGAIRMDTGDVQGTGSVGEINIRAGAALNGTGGAGSITITSGGATGSINAGTFNLRGGTAVDGAGGTIEIEAGEATGTGTGGDVDITGGVVNIHGANGEIAQSSVLLWDDTNTAHTTGNYVEITVPAGIGSPTPTSWTLTLPPNDGTAGQVLQTDGAGVTTWETAGGVTNPLTADLDVDGFSIVGAVGGTPATISLPNSTDSAASFDITGRAFAGGGVSADINIIAGAATNANNAGDIFVTGGVNPIGTGDAGSATIAGGESNTTGDAGNATVIGGRKRAAADQAGNAILEGGPGQTAASAGDAIIKGGLTATTSGTPTHGNVIIRAHDYATNSIPDEGKVIIEPGRSAAAEGTIEFHSGTNGTGQASIQFWNDTDTGHTTGNYVAIAAPNPVGSPSPANWTLTLPPNDGTANQMLMTDGSGNTSWSTELKEFSETSNSYGTTGAQALDTSTGTYFYSTGATTGIITFTFTNPATTGRVTSFTLELSGAGDNAPVWPASVKWPGGIEPTWTTVAGSPVVNGSDVVSFVTRDGGTTWLGMLGGLGFA